MKNKLFNLIVPDYETIADRVYIYMKYSKHKILYFIFKEQFKQYAKCLQYDIAKHDRGLDSFI